MISLPLNVFYGAGVPACLLILRKQRPPERHDKVLLVYAARHYRELSTQNELRPQDVMRMLVHYHAYGDAAKVPGLVARAQPAHPRADQPREQEEVERLEAEYADARRHASPSWTPSLPRRAAELARSRRSRPRRPRPRRRCASWKASATSSAAKIAERDERIAEARRRAEDDRARRGRRSASELGALYGDPDELLKHARVVGLDEIEENEFNLNIPRYVDTFEPEPRVEVKDALKALREAEAAAKQAEDELTRLLRGCWLCSTDCFPETPCRLATRPIGRAGCATSTRAIR